MDVGEKSGEVKATLPYSAMDDKESSALQRRLQACVNELYYDENKVGQWQKIFAKHLLDDEYRHIVNELKVNIGEGMDSTRVIDSYIKNLQVQLHDLPVIDLQIAITPRKEFLQELVEWFELKLDRPAKIKVTVSPSIVGGVIVGLNGSKIDNSIASKLNKYGK